MDKIELANSVNHAKRIADLAKTIWNQHYVNIIGQQQVDYMLEEFQSDSAILEQIKQGQHYFIISEIEHGDVGYSSLIIDPQSTRIKLSKLYVKSSNKGKGFGRKLLEHAINFSKAHSADTLWLTVNKYNADSITWYQKQGFVITEEMVADIGHGYVMDDYVMKLTLP